MAPYKALVLTKAKELNSVIWPIFYITHAAVFLASISQRPTCNFLENSHLCTN